jgi:hypothetical protein
MKMLRATAFALLMAFMGMCAFLAYQAGPNVDSQQGSFYRIRVPCVPHCSENQQIDRQIDQYIAKLNSEHPVKLVTVR